MLFSHFLKFDDKPTADNLPLWPQLSKQSPPENQPAAQRGEKAVRKQLLPPALWSKCSPARTMPENYRSTGLLTIENMTKQIS